MIRILWFFFHQFVGLHFGPIACGFQFASWNWHSTTKFRKYNHNGTQCRSARRKKKKKPSPFMWWIVEFVQTNRSRSTVVYKSIVIDYYSTWCLSAIQIQNTMTHRVQFQICFSFSFIFHFEYLVHKSNTFSIDAAAAAAKSKLLLFICYFVIVTLWYHFLLLLLFHIYYSHFFFADLPQS